MQLARLELDAEPPVGIHPNFRDFHKALVTWLDAREHVFLRASMETLEENFAIEKALGAEAIDLWLACLDIIWWGTEIVWPVKGDKDALPGHSGRHLGGRARHRGLHRLAFGVLRQRQHPDEVPHLGEDSGSVLADGHGWRGGPHDQFQPVESKACGQFKEWTGRSEALWAYATIPRLVRRAVGQCSQRMLARMLLSLFRISGPGQSPLNLFQVNSKPIWWWAVRRKGRLLNFFVPRSLLATLIDCLSSMIMTCDMYDVWHDRLTGIHYILNGY